MITRTTTSAASGVVSFASSIPTSFPWETIRADLTERIEALLADVVAILNGTGEATLATDTWLIACADLMMSIVRQLPAEQRKGLCVRLALASTAVEDHLYMQAVELRRVRSALQAP